MNPTEQEIRDAVHRLYGKVNQALNGDAGPILEEWSHAPDATVMHPGGGRQQGWDEVRAAWEQWAGSVTDGGVQAGELSIHLLAPDIALVSGHETGSGVLMGERCQVDARMTLVLRRENGRWRPVHHHADVVPAIRDAATRAASLAGAAA
ncbi:MAG TPA: DUF4440 domain-containing protein [Longimicrobium sp.]